MTVSAVAQRLGESRLGQSEHPNRVLPVHGSAGDRLLHAPRSARPWPTSAVARAAGRGERRPSALPGDHDTRCGADRVEYASAHGHHGLLAVGGHHRLEVHSRRERCISVLRMLAIFVLELDVQHEFAVAELRHRRDRHVVGGRAQSPAGDDEVDALAGEEAQLRLDVLGPVTADRDVREFDAEFEQPVGEPRAVAVLDPSGQYFGSRDDDARAHTHGV